MNRRRASTTSPARPSRRSPSPAALDEGLVTPRPPSRCRRRIQVADRTIEDAEPRGTVTPQRRPDPRPVLERRRGDDRARSWAPASSADWIDRFGFGQPTGIAVSRGGTGDRAAADQVLGLDDGQPADRAGPLGDADADGRRLHGDRQRRHPAAAAADREDRRRAGPEPTGHRRHHARRSPRRCGHARGRAGARAGRPPRSASPATPWPARREPRRSPKTAPTPTRSSSPPSSGFAPAQDPQLLVAVIVDEPQGGTTTAARSPRRRSARSRRSRCLTSASPPRLGIPSADSGRRSTPTPRHPPEMRFGAT